MFAARLIFVFPVASLFLCAQQFATDISPIFRKRCLGCHGVAMQQNGLRLDAREAAMRGGYSGAVIVPGNAEGSRLIQLVEGRKGRTMPPAGPPLKAEEIALLRAWIDKGAEWPEASARVDTTERTDPRARHWAFQPIVKPIPPITEMSAIDAFVRARLAKEGIAPAPETDRATLLRRVSLDLIGLPPTVEETQAFLKDSRPDAYERAVDRLLASSHFGEKWARHWLDLARYADSDGYQKDEFRPNAFRYRDWVIQAFNRNMPFDRFSVEQIAGDLLPASGVEERTATGFHRMTLTSREAGIDLKQLRAEQVADRANTFGSVWLGLTTGCAMCHDHKFDPISQREYYQLYAYFNTSSEESLDAPRPEELERYRKGFADYKRKRDALWAEYRATELAPAFWAKMREASKPGAPLEWVANLELLPVLIDKGLEIFATPEAQRTDYESEQLMFFFLRTYGRVTKPEDLKDLKFKELLGKLDSLHAEYPRYSEPMVLAEMPKPPSTHIHIRGDFRDPGIEVKPGTLRVLPAMPSDAPANRLGLAHWLVSRGHPLTARVAVNRLWQELFGRGLVATSEDFGARGEAPSHPELLDWLATDFQSNWDVKRAIRQMVLSATYRQSSKPRPELQTSDPYNRLLARQSRHRLTAEAVRDSVLAVSGLLSAKVGGPSVRPPLPEGVTDLGFEDFMKWPESKGEDKYRRALYTVSHRSVPYPQMAMFDAPDGLVSCSRRTRSTTALQALTLLNDPVFVEAAQALAARVLRERAQAGLQERIDHLFALTLSRAPLPKERDRLTAYYVKRGPAGEIDKWTGLGSIVLNLDEFLTRE